MNNNIFNIPKYEIKDWLNGLKPYQKKNLEFLLGNLDNINYEIIEIAAEKWLSANGPDNTVSFGGTDEKNIFFNNLKDEFNKFLCDENSYIDAKIKLKEKQNVAKEVLISVISGAIAIQLGVAAALIVPIIMLLLYYSCEIGTNAYCKTYYNN